MHTLTRIILFVCVCLLVVSAADRQPAIKKEATNVHQN
jgi:hypothetical protein